MLPRIGSFDEPAFKKLAGPQVLCSDDSIFFDSVLF